MHIFSYQGKKNKIKSTLKIIFLVGETSDCTLSENKMKPYLKNKNQKI